MSQSPTCSHRSPLSTVRLCQGCELPVDSISIAKGKSAYCPRCGTQLYRGGNPSLSGNLAIAITCLLLFIPSHFFDFISIRLVGVMIPATLPEGIWALIQEGFPLLALLIVFRSKFQQSTRRNQHFAASGVVYHILNLSFLPGW